MHQRRRMRQAGVLIAMLIAAPGAFGQAPAIEIGATVRMAEIVFHDQPVVDVRFTAPQNTNVWSTERPSLPSPVQPKTIYRDVGIRLTITSTLPGIERIVDEALAEVAARKESSDETRSHDSRSLARRRNSRGAAAAGDDHQHQRR